MGLDPSLKKGNRFYRLAHEDTEPIVDRIIAPLVFVFLLSDAGEIKRGILSAVPNPLFEPAVRVLEDLDRALGSYLRGLFLECALLGLSVTVLLVIVGVSPRWAITIGIFTGATDVIPYMLFGIAGMLPAVPVITVFKVFVSSTARQLKAYGLV